MSIPSYPSPGNSLLAQHLGSDAAAFGERRRIRQRQRADANRYRTLAQRESQADIQHLLAVALPAMVRAETQRLRAELHAVVRAEVQQILAEELPEAVEYLTRGRREVARNGSS